jgi:hypothetical protein
MLNASTTSAGKIRVLNMGDSPFRRKQRNAPATA